MTLKKNEIDLVIKELWLQQVYWFVVELILKVCAAIDQLGFFQRPHGSV